MIKYKVKDAAADFGVPNKKITEILEKHCGVSKKTMTTLQESELDVLFDVLTKENAVESFDSYFAVRNAKLEKEAEPAPEQKEESKPAEQKAESEGEKPAQNAPAAAEKPGQQRGAKYQSHDMTPFSLKQTAHSVPPASAGASSASGCASGAECSLMNPAISPITSSPICLSVPYSLDALRISSYMALTKTWFSSG